MRKRASQNVISGGVTRHESQFKIDSKNCKSIRNTTNRSETLQLDPKHYKQIRNDSNRSETIQIDPKHFDKNQIGYR